MLTIALTAKQKKILKPLMEDVSINSSKNHKGMALLQIDDGCNFARGFFVPNRASKKLQDIMVKEKLLPEQPE